MDKDCLTMTIDESVAAWSELKRSRFPVFELLLKIVKFEISFRKQLVNDLFAEK